MSEQAKQLQTMSVRLLPFVAAEHEAREDKTVWFGASTSCAQTHCQHDKEGNVLSESITLHFAEGCVRLQVCIKHRFATVHLEKTTFSLESESLVQKK